MKSVTILYVGVDLAKNRCVVHGVDERAGRALVRATIEVNSCLLPTAVIETGTCKDLTTSRGREAERLLGDKQREYDYQLAPAATVKGCLIPARTGIDRVSRTGRRAGVEQASREETAACASVGGERDVPMGIAAAACR